MGNRMSIKTGGKDRKVQNRKAQKWKREEKMFLKGSTYASHRTYQHDVTRG